MGTWFLHTPQVAFFLGNEDFTADREEVYLAHGITKVNNNSNPHIGILVLSPHCFSLVAGCLPPSHLSAVSSVTVSKHGPTAPSTSSLTLGLDNQ